MCVVSGSKRRFSFWFLSVSGSKRQCSFGLFYCFRLKASTFLWFLLRQVQIIKIDDVLVQAQNVDFPLFIFMCQALNGDFHVLIASGAKRQFSFGLHSAGSN